ncbi:MAG: hypothetical protein ACE367_14530 [Acidimicrobiales bacterium]
MTTPRSRHRTLLSSSALAIAVLAAGCGGSDDAADTPVVVVEDSDTATGETTADDTSAATADAETSTDGTTDEEQALAFAQCMRDEGIDLPDPVVDADGSIDFGGANRDREQEGFAQDPGFGDAIDTCGALIEGASFLPEAGDFTEREDLFLEVAECLRDNGIDVPDPQFGQNGPGAGGPFGEDFDPDDPDTADAIEACQDVFAGLDIAPGGGN